MTKAGVTYAAMVTRLAKHGFNESEATLMMNHKRGTFGATFLFAGLAALELEGVRLVNL